VKNRVDPSLRLLALAAAQAGVLTREQATGHGLGDDSVTRLLRGGRWQRLATGLYFTESAAVPWPALAWGGVLLGGENALLGGDAAAHLHDLIDSPPDVITVLVPHGTRRVARGPWQFVQMRDGIRRRAQGTPPRLDVEDTVLDACDSAAPAEIVDIVSRAVQRRRTTADRLRRRLDERPRHSQRKLLIGVVTNVGDGAESPLELRYLTEVERRHALPRGRRQHRSRGAVRDVYYEEFGVVAELDGRAGHEGRGRHRDMRRDNRSTLVGESTLRYGWWDVLERPCLVAAEVAALLRRRGWRGVPHLCPNCDGSRLE
jgi:hypothetical protein